MYNTSTGIPSNMQAQPGVAGAYGYGAGNQGKYTTQNIIAC